jgi:hypothetical protein
MNVAQRETWRGRVWRVAALRLIGEHDGKFVLWHPEGSIVKRPFAGERELRIPGDEDWRLVDRPSETEGLGFVRPGTRHSLWLMFRGGRFESWYVNFERDSVRRGACFDLVDEKLDLVVFAGGELRLKDEDELAAAARIGYLDEDEVLRELERVRADPPWPTGWEDWRPDPAWPAPQLPEGWDVVRETA